MLADITRHSRFTAEEFRVLATERPLDVPGFHRRIRAMIEDAERFIGRVASDAVSFTFLEGEKPVQPAERFQAVAANRPPSLAGSIAVLAARVRISANTAR
jgi:hypothetical protein